VSDEVTDALSGNKAQVRSTCKSASAKAGPFTATKIATGCMSDSLIIPFPQERICAEEALEHSQCSSPNSDLLAQYDTSSLTDKIWGNPEELREKVLQEYKNAAVSDT